MSKIQKKEESKKSNKKLIKKILPIIIFVFGLGIFLYPTISILLSQHNQTCVINNYIESINTFSDEELKEKSELTQKYNEELSSVTFNDSGISYVDFIELGEVIGYVEIPKIEVNLPIYQGISDDILRVGVGHIVKSSLPSENDTSHVVLTGHRGLPTSTLFTDLNKIEINDVFSIISLNKKYTYKVDQIKVVLPEETDDLRIIDGKKYATLITCTPYMINTHRLLVRGELLNVEELNNISEDNSQDENNIDTNIINNYKTILKEIEYMDMPILIFNIIVIIMLYIIIYLIFFKKGKEKNVKYKFGKRQAIAIIIFIIGIGFILFPYLIQKINKAQTEKFVDDFKFKIEEEINVSKDDGNNKFSMLLEKIKEYNLALHKKGQDNIFDPFLFETSSINLNSLGFKEDIIGNIEIPKMDIKLPIYLGASYENMRKGAVHLNGTSLPIGGENTNTVIAAHRGLITNAMFRNIQTLEIGDSVFINNYWETLEYKVIDTKIISPDQIENIYIQDGKDLITLITCHPYRVNTHRYLVYCERVN